MTLEVNTASLTTVPQWRHNLVHILQLAGILLGFIGGAEYLQLMALFPPEASAWLLVAGPAFASGARPLITLIGDLMDDGLHNNSFKITGPILAMLACLLFTPPACSVSYDGTGKPTFALDAVALAKIIADWQEVNDAKDADVKIVDTAAGQTLVAVKPNGTVITEVINPANVIVK